MALLPMAVAFLTGKELQGSMYWAMSIIGLKKYTVLVFRIICFAVVATTIVSIVFLIRGIRKKTISFTENRPIHTEAKVLLIIFKLFGVLILAVLLFLGWSEKEIVFWGFSQYVFDLTDFNWMIYAVGIAVLVGIVQSYFMKNMEGAALLSLLSAEVMLGIILVSDKLGLPVLMENYRVCVYFSYLIPIVFILALDNLIGILCFNRLMKIQKVIAFGMVIILLGYGTKEGWVKESFGGGDLEMNEAILCTTNILKDNKGKNDTWTIVSENDELRMVELYGIHTETIIFLEQMEHWNQTKEILIPTERVYFYIEKKPLNYADEYEGKIPEISEKQAQKALPESTEMNAYSGTNRSVMMSRMYYWAQEFQKLYPNEFKVYFEDENFVCYYIEQNVYCLYNFAIDYGYN